MATMNLFEMMGIKLEEEKETTTEVKKEKKKIRLPFIPALFLGYVMTISIGGMS